MIAGGLQPDLLILAEAGGLEVEGDHVAQRADEPGREVHPIGPALGVAGNLHPGVENRGIDEIAGVLQLDGGSCRRPAWRRRR